MVRKNIKELIELADKIPELGYGGKIIKQELILAAANAPSDTTIIDIAPYLGSTTAYLLIGCNISKRDIEIYSIDKWEGDKEYRGKAKIHNGIDFVKGEDLQPIWKKNIDPFSDFSTTAIKGDIINFEYESKKSISVYVDDICNNKIKHDHAMKIFSPYFIPGKTILFLMDYFFYEKKGELNFGYQRDFMHLNSDVFLNLGKIGKSFTCMFIYLGGIIKYPKK